MIRTKIDIALLIALLLLGLCSIMSCTTQKKAVRWFDNHPAVAARYSLEKFPTDTVTKLIPGEPIHHRDTSYILDTVPVRVPCPPHLTDTEYVEIPVPVQVPVYRDSSVTVDTLQYIVERKEKDAIIASQNKEISQLKDRLIVQSELTKEAEKKARNANIRFWGLLTLAVAGLFLRFKKII